MQTMLIAPAGMTDVNGQLNPINLRNTMDSRLKDTNLITEAKKFGAAFTARDLTGSWKEYFSLWQEQEDFPLTGEVRKMAELAYTYMNGDEEAAKSLLKRMVSNNIVVFKNIDEAWFNQNETAAWVSGGGVIKSDFLGNIGKQFDTVVAREFEAKGSYKDFNKRNNYAEGVAPSMQQLLNTGKVRLTGVNDPSRTSAHDQHMLYLRLVDTSNGQFITDEFNQPIELAYKASPLDTTADSTNREGFVGTKPLIPAPVNTYMNMIRAPHLMAAAELNNIYKKKTIY
jgi:hypothetical protein